MWSLLGACFGSKPHEKTFGPGVVPCFVSQLPVCFASWLVTGLIFVLACSGKNFCLLCVLCFSRSWLPVLRLSFNMRNICGSCVCDLVSPAAGSLFRPCNRRNLCLPCVPSFLPQPGVLRLGIKKRNLCGSAVCALVSPAAGSLFRPCNRRNLCLPCVPCFHAAGNLFCVWALAGGTLEALVCVICSVLQSSACFVNFWWHKICALIFVNIVALIK